MDESLEKVLVQVKDRVEVLEGENPLADVADAIRLLERNGLLFRWAQNGATYEMRWTEEHPPILYHEATICTVACERIIEQVKPKRKVHEDSAPPAPPQKEVAKTTTTKRSASKKS